jgi:hypothetical protein
MTKAARMTTEQTAAAAAPEDGRLKLQAFAAPLASRRTNWELRPLGARAFELASARV